MSSPPDDLTSLNQSRYAPNLVNKLLVGWVCALLFGWGLFLPYVVIGGFAAAAAYSFGAFDAANWIRVTAIIGLGTFSVGPLLLSVFLERSWKQGIKNSLLAVLAGAISLIIENMVLDAIPTEWRRSVFFPGLSTVILGIHAAAIILMILTRSTYSSANDLTGLAVGTLVGLSFSFVIGQLIDTGKSHILWEGPPLIWISVIYFSELISGRSRWLGFLVWVMLTLFTFGMIFWIVARFP